MASKVGFRTSPLPNWSSGVGMEGLDDTLGFGRGWTRLGVYGLVRGVKGWGRVRSVERVGGARKREARGSRFQIENRASEVNAWSSIRRQGVGLVVRQVVGEGSRRGIERGEGKARLVVTRCNCRYTRKP